MSNWFVFYGPAAIKETTKSIHRVQVLRSRWLAMYVLCMVLTTALQWVEPFAIAKNKTAVRTTYGVATTCMTSAEFKNVVAEKSVTSKEPTVK
jgi:hypothetical protein